MYYVYILTNLDNGTPYIGYSFNLKQRISEHKKTKNIKLVYYESYLTESLARIREIKLKQYGSAWKGLKKRIFPKP